MQNTHQANDSQQGRMQIYFLCITVIGVDEIWTLEDFLANCPITTSCAYKEEFGSFSVY
jgi:hypothetical protein